MGAYACVVPLSDPTNTTGRSGLVFICLSVCLSVLQAYSAALQTQWQWVKQLCVCVEQHLKDNAAYFQVGQPRAIGTNPGP